MHSTSATTTPETVQFTVQSRLLATKPASGSGVRDRRHNAASGSLPVLCCIYCTLVHTATTGRWPTPNLAAVLVYPAVMMVRLLAHHRGDRHRSICSVAKTAAPGVAVASAGRADRFVLLMSVVVVAVLVAVLVAIVTVAVVGFCRYRRSQRHGRGWELDAHSRSTVTTF
eukprot:TRINITY_DN66218_c12_g4_i1.p1 TRINITY_DN66218_c12_g4~~TRINITY_DN66218_c12_g4_i1.p1  ORF type:complete len:170 (-),score=13.99 TRINITY_DN66218_c12_g4_i1:39-548(-)